MAKFKLNKPVLLQEEFAAGEVSNPGQNVTPAAKTEPASVAVDKTDIKGAEIRAEIIADVDTILTNLETLSKQITEEVLREVDVIIAETLAQPIYENKFFEEMMKEFRSMKAYAKLSAAWSRLYKATLDQELKNLDDEKSFDAEKDAKIEGLIAKVKDKFEKSKEKIKDMQIPGEKKRQERAKIDKSYQQQEAKIKEKMAQKLNSQLEQLKAQNAKKLQDIKTNLSDFEAENKIESELLNKRWATEKGNQKSKMDIDHIGNKSEVKLKYDLSDDPEYAKKVQAKAAEETRRMDKEMAEKNAKREQELKDLQAEADERAVQGSEEEKEANKKIKDLYSSANAYINALKSMPIKDKDITDEIVANVKSVKKKYTAAKSEVTENTFIKGKIASDKLEAKKILEEITKMIDDALSEYSDKAKILGTKQSKFEKAIESAEEKANDAKNDLDLIKDNGSPDDIKDAQKKYWNAEIEVQKAKKAQAENDGDDVSSFDSKIAELQDKIDNVDGGGQAQAQSAKEVAQAALGDAFGDYTKITDPNEQETITNDAGEETTRNKWTDVKRFKGKDADGNETQEEVIYAKRNDNQSAATVDGVDLKEGNTSITESASFKMGSVASRFRSLM